MKSDICCTYYVLKSDHIYRTSLQKLLCFVVALMLTFPFWVLKLLEGTFLSYRTCDNCRKTQNFGFSQENVSTKLCK